MNRTHSFIAVTLAATTLVACSLPGCEATALAAPEPPPAAEANADANLARSIDQAILKRDLGQFWGAVLVARGGQIISAKGYGIENDQLHPIDADTLFDIGSIAKQFTAAAVLRLEMDGKLSIDDPVSKYFPKAGVRSETITLKHLLSHTSGQPAEGTIQRLDFPDRDEAVRLFFQPVGVEPGSKFEYNNAGYVVLAAVIEKASGKDFAAYVREAVFKPAGLTQTGFLDGVGIDTARGAARVVTGAGARPRRLDILQDGWGWGFKGCGGILTTMNDLVRWNQALSGDSVLNTAAKTKLFQVAKGDYALGWFVESTPDGRTRQYHTGGTRGFRAALSRFPADHPADGPWLIAVLTNERQDPTAIEKLVTELVFPDAKPEARSVLLTGGLKLNEHKLAEFDDGVQLRLSAPDGRGRRTLTVAHEEPDQSRTLATIALDKPAVLKLWTDLKKSLGSRNAADDPHKTSCIIATLPYTPVDGRIALPDACQLRVMPRYVGVNEKGQERVDERVTLIIVDDDAGFWPIIVKMDAKSAKELSDALRAQIAR